MLPPLKGEDMTRPNKRNPPQSILTEKEEHHIEEHFVEKGDQVGPISITPTSKKTDEYKNMENMITLLKNAKSQAVQLTDQDQEMVKLKNKVDRQARRIKELLIQLQPMIRLQKLEKIGTFQHIASDEIMGFEQFEHQLLQYPTTAQYTLRQRYRQGWERAYWYGFLKGRNKPDEIT